MTAKEIMKLALELAGIDEVPADSGIINDTDDVHRILTGIGTEGPEILLGKAIGVDLVLGHHPSCSHSGLGMKKMVADQEDRLIACGIPANRAQKLLAARVKELEHIVQGGNYDRIDTTAKLLGVPYMNIHTPADIIIEKLMQERIDERIAGKPKATLQDVLDAILTIPEFTMVPEQQRPSIWVGSPDSYAGKVLVTMSGGTNAGVIPTLALYEAGIGTIVCMHESEEVAKAVQEQNIGNMIVSGHMASDSAGMNVILRKLEEQGIEVIRMSGLIG